MTLLVFSALLATLAGAYVIRPILVRRGALLVDVAPGAVLDAEARRRVALASLKELEYDYLGGKLDEADYRAQRERLGLEALAAIRASEAVGGGIAVVSDSDRHACGFVNLAGSRFCAGCGTRL
ncbi:MAG TPA: zinc ribbon domain-containing protein [Longimicrobium sp.]|nr:zinc ribbon domain-containing protein [Longimicrobium sp.]